MEREDLAELVRSQRVSPKETAAAIEGREASIRIVDQFPPGTTVRLVECAPAAREVPEGKATATAKAGKDTIVEFSRGVKVGHYYFAVGEIDEAGGSFVRSMKVRGKFHGKGENVRPPAAFVAPLDEDEPEPEPRRRKARKEPRKAAAKAEPAGHTPKIKK